MRHAVLPPLELHEQARTTPSTFPAHVLYRVEAVTSSCCDGTLALSPLATSITRPYVVEEEEVPKRCALGLCVATTKEVDGQAVCVCCAELPQDAEGLAKYVCADCTELPFTVELVGEVSEVDRQAVEETVWRLRGTHVGRQISEGARDSSVARFDITRILELMNETRSGSEQCNCLVAVRENERTEIRQPDRKGSEGRGDVTSRQLGGHQRHESVLLNTLRYRHHHRLLVVDALDPCDRARSCLDVSHSTLPQSTFVCPSVEDASPCTSPGLSCGCRYVDFDAAVAVQRTAATSGVQSV